MPELIKHLLETCERLVKIEADWADANMKVITGVFNKIEKKKSDTLTRTEKVALSEYFDIRFSNGKIAGYIFILQQLHGGKFTIPAEYPMLTNWVKHKLQEYAGK